jgi:hypothetical protein
LLLAEPDRQGVLALADHLSRNWWWKLLSGNEFQIK